MIAKRQLNIIAMLLHALNLTNCIEKNKRIIFRILGLLAVLSLVACAGPAVKLDRYAQSAGFSKEILQGDEFQHMIYENRRQGHTALLHIYLSGDGTPWQKRFWVSSDPTPRSSFILRLMQQDPQSAIFVGRPCYHGFAKSEACSPTLWTYSRYSERVVKSMARVIRKLLDPGAYRHVVLIGYSGGGALSMLLAERIPETIGVVTIAGLLDTDAWTTEHGYTPLYDSLNPAKRDVLSTELFQLHYVGKLDENVKPKLVEKSINRQPNAKMIMWEKYNHGCCWVKAWPGILADIQESTDDYLNTRR